MPDLSAVSMALDLEVYQTEPIIWLRQASAIVSAAAVPLILWVTHHSAYRRLFFFRLGMLLVVAGFLYDVAGMLGLAPFNAEWWILKNAGVISFTAAIALGEDYRRPA